MSTSVPASFDVDGLVEYLDSASIRLAVFGEFSAGKTTVLNALIGEEILSVAVEPTTAVPTRVRYGREFNIFVERTDGETLALFEDDPPFWTRFVGRRDTLSTLQKQQDTIRDFLRTWTKEGERADAVERVVIELPLDWLKGGLELVDTPGVNNEFVRHQGFTEQEAGAADIAVLLMDARQGGGKRTEFEFMNEVQQQVERCLVAPNKLDLVPADEREEFLTYIRETALPKHWDGAVTPPVHGISALAALHPEEHDEPDLVDAFADLRGRLETMAEEERGTLLLARKGNPEKQLFGRAKELEGEEHYGRAHRLYFDLLDVLEAAGLDPTPAEEGIARCEEHLSAQVDALDTLNERYNEAMAMAEEDPDAALERLEAIRDEKEDLRLEDGDLHASIEQLRSRIEERDAARQEIQEIKAQVEQHRHNEDWIKAAETVQEIRTLIEDADLSESKEQELRDFIDNQIDQRDSWIDEQWPEAKGCIDTHLNKGDPRQAKEALEPFVDVPPKAPNAPHATEIEETEARIQTQLDALEAFQDSKSKILTQIGQLQEKQVDRSTGRFILQTLRRLAESRRELYEDIDATIDFTKIELKIDAKGHALTIGEKINLVEVAGALLEDGVNRLQELKVQLTERKEELQNLNPNVPRNREELFSECPDHPVVAEQTLEKLTNLEQACKHGDKKRVKQIIGDCGQILINLKPYRPGRAGELLTPLMLVAREGYPDIVKILLDAGADPSVESSDGYTALLLAAYEGNSECVEHLLEGGADPEAKDAHGYNTLDWALKKEHEEVEKHLRDMGATLNTPSLREEEQSRSPASSESGMLKTNCRNCDKITTHEEVKKSPNRKVWKCVVCDQKRSSAKSGKSINKDAKEVVGSGCMLLIVGATVATSIQACGI